MKNEGGTENAQKRCPGKKLMYLFSQDTIDILKESG